MAARKPGAGFKLYLLCGCPSGGVTYPRLPATLGPLAHHLLRGHKTRWLEFVAVLLREPPAPPCSGGGANDMLLRVSWCLGRLPRPFGAASHMLGHSVQLIGPTWRHRHRPRPRHRICLCFLPPACALCFHQLPLHFASSLPRPPSGGEGSGRAMHYFYGIIKI